jgi:hypothetical protein
MRNFIFAFGLMVSFSVFADGFVPVGGGGGLATNLPATTHILSGNGTGGASDSGIVPSNVATQSGANNFTNAGNSFSGTFSGNGSGLINSNFPAVTNYIYLNGPPNNLAIFSLAGGGDTNVNVFWSLAGTNGMGIAPPNFYYTNSLNTLLVVSNLLNTGISKYGITNPGVSGVEYNIRQALFVVGNNSWLVGSGSNPAPVFAEISIPNYVNTSSGLFLSAINTNNLVANVEVLGNDLIGTLGSFPYATVSGVHSNALAINYNTNATEIRLGIGVFSNGYPSILKPGDSLIGADRYQSVLNYSNSTIFGEPLGSGVIFIPSIGSNYIANLTCQLIDVASGQTSGQQLVLNNLEIGNLYGIDCLYQPGNTPFALTIANNDHFISGWDVNFNFGSIVFNNCTWDMNDEFQSPTQSGMHAVLSINTNQTIILIGGVINMTSTLPTNYFTAPAPATNCNACIYLPNNYNSSGSIIRVYGTIFNRTSLTNNSTFSICNSQNFTNIQGYFYDSVNGGIPVLTFVNGTNLYQPYNPNNNTITGSGSGLTSIPPSGISGTGAFSLHTNAAPVNTTTPLFWTAVTNLDNGQVYKTPWYQ